MDFGRKNMHHLPTSLREKLFNFSRKDVSRKKYFTYRRLSGQFFLCMQDIGRIKSIAEDNLMFVYERFFDKLTPNPQCVEPNSPWWFVTVWPPNTSREKHWILISSPTRNIPSRLLNNLFYKALLCASAYFQAKNIKWLWYRKSHF